MLGRIVERRSKVVFVYPLVCFFVLGRRINK